MTNNSKGFALGCFLVLFNILIHIGLFVGAIWLAVQVLQWLGVL